MIKESTILKNNASKFVTRICDECGIEERTRMNNIVKGRERRGKDIDLCKKCSYNIKYKNTPFSKVMEKAVNWKGGKSIITGYSRIYVGGGKRIFEHIKIYEEQTGKKIKKPQRLHHIDMDKLNNNINNLYLCKDNSHHYSCHISAEKYGYTLLGQKIWFNENSFQYVLYRVKSRIVDVVDLSEYNKNTKYIVNIGKKSGRTRISYWRYYFYDKSVYEHTLVAEKMIGRKLYRNECVHHINGDSLDNNPSNLYVLTIAQHKNAHNSLQFCIAELYREGIVKFKNGKYYA